ncbi:hypothetical protein G6M89_14350 [Natronolimnobius sp. AArcel1]|uniref:hypothetical protein n=1 Tax=Natronolimnobius sp. AArcel1 TaxID=1679093 RepID=UPI0013EC56E1|nr:hypothetical protein [Natronolimnobius sp. AArcel1]NGM70175.1 hypothetical protein [Natronolimnobius sp. AArcel1]
MTLGGRFAVFVAVYGVLLGLATLVGRRGESTVSDRDVVLLTGIATAIFALVSTILIFWTLGNGIEAELLVLAAGFGMAISAGIQSAVVSFAGICLGRRYR